MPAWYLLAAGGGARDRQPAITHAAPKQRTQHAQGALTRPRSPTTRRPARTTASNRASQESPAASGADNPQPNTPSTPSEPAGATGVLPTCGRLGGPGACARSQLHGGVVLLPRFVPERRLRAALIVILRARRAHRTLPAATPARYTATIRVHTVHIQMHRANRQLAPPEGFRISRFKSKFQFPLRENIDPF